MVYEATPRHFDGGSQCVFVSLDVYKAHYYEVKDMDAQSKRVYLQKHPHAELLIDIQSQDVSQTAVHVFEVSLNGDSDNDESSTSDVMGSPLLSSTRTESTRPSREGHFTFLKGLLHYDKTETEVFDK